MATSIRAEGESMWHCSRGDENCRAARFCVAGIVEEFERALHDMMDLQIVVMPVRDRVAPENIRQCSYGAILNIVIGESADLYFSEVDAWNRASLIRDGMGREIGAQSQQLRASGAAMSRVDRTSHRLIACFGQQLLHDTVK